MAEIARTAQEIYDAWGDVDSEAAAGGRSRWPGMNYEQGVDAALSWVLGDREEKPMEDDG